MNANNPVLKSLIFKFIERVGVKLIALVISIILARLLEPNTFGLLAILTVFVNLCQVFVQGGLNVALIQTPKLEKKDYSTVFWISLLLAVALYFILFVSAPLISNYYNTSELIQPLRVLAISLIFGAFNSVQTAQLSRDMSFGVQLICNLITTSVAGIIGIVMAYLGYGLWALVSYQLLSQIILCVTMLFAAKWRPKFEFSTGRAKVLIKYGWKIMFSNVFYSLYTDIRSLIIAKEFSAEALAYYDRGNQLPNIVSYNLDTAIQSVMLPALSRQQDNTVVIKDKLRKMVQISTFLITPIMFGIAAISEEFVYIFLSAKWKEAIPYLIVFSIGYIFLPVSSSCNVAIKAIGRSDVFAKNQTIRIIVMIIILVISVFVFHNVFAISIGYSISLLAEMIIAIFPANKYLGYKFKQVAMDLFENLLPALIMGIIVYAFGFIKTAYSIRFLLKVFAGILSYTGLCHLFKNRNMNYVASFAKQMLHRG